jgi:error-prone DNA polymerase
MKHLTAFANYGFPESHAASFALLVYASAWLKRYYAPEFTCALLNAQPMGFYAPSTIVHDARRHGVEVRPVDLARSEWDSTLEAEGVEGAPPLREASASVFPASDPRVQLPVPVAPPALRLGLRLVHGLGPKARERLRAAREGGRFTSVEDVVRRSGLRAPELRALAEGGAFETLWPGRREALWEVLRQARGDAGPLARRFPGPRRPLPPLSPLEATLADYRVTGVSPGGHPMRFLRAELERRGVLPAEALRGRRDGERVRVAGLAICRQRPGTAKGIMFVTLEDETGLANFVVMPNVGERLRRTLRAPLLLLEGTLENEQGVVNVLVRDAARLDFSGREIRSVSRDFR